MAKRPKKSNNNKKASVLVVFLCLIVAALVVTTAVLIFPNLLSGLVSQTTASSSTESESQPTTTADNGKILPGVKIGGVDVSGMTETEAKAATVGLVDDLLEKINISVTVGEADSQYTAEDLGITTDYDEALAKALAYGHTGTAEERRQAADVAASRGVDFTVQTEANKVKIMAALIPLKEKVDVAPVNASCVFMPSGYTADGTAYQPDPRKLADANSRGKNLDRPELVQVDPAEMPSALRYLYWKTRFYVDGYIPADANISRFLYSPEKNGLSLDIDALADQIMTQLESGSFSAITAEGQVIEPELKLQAVKDSTKMIASWTSCYYDHRGVNRNWNVSRMSSFINGAVLQPGQEWSVNKTAGYRNEKTAATIGWREAAGIENGGYTQQVGGGVCQLGSTTFNAAIRAGITIVSSTHHTIPSDYIPLGLDATLSTPAPDLILRNDNTMPVYIVSYVNPKDYNVTVEVYGQQPIDPVYGPVIYNFTSNNKGTRYGTPTMRIVYNATVALDETILSAENPVYVYAAARAGTEIQTYKHIFSLDGTELCDPIPYEHHKYPMINGLTYMFGPDPATVTPSPSPSVSPSPSATPSPTPTTAPSPEPTP